jgi:hypothetical protein
MELRGLSELMVNLVALADRLADGRLVIEQSGDAWITSLTVKSEKVLETRSEYLEEALSELLVAAEVKNLERAHQRGTVSPRAV